MNPTSRNGLMLLVLMLIGINMRPLLTSIGPLLPQLQQASGMGFSLVSLLTAIPVIAMGLLALASPWTQRHISESRGIVLSLMMIASGAALREFTPHSGLLLSSALLGGIGIGIIQATIPAVIKRQFPPPNAAGHGPVVSGADGWRRPGSRVDAVAGAAQRPLALRARLVGPARHRSAA
ncbi:putative cyanate transporter [Raoultella planticola]|uniref:Putative cyanate transporter n=1 Tax=Raoultella planticola TaxID=575 RepID=A0A485C572_RAOPL|nr:putative cyanate transporter [Raoultella planticola]